MKVLHVLDHSVPVSSGYAFRSLGIVRFQQRLGLSPVVLTSPRQGVSAAPMDVADNIAYYRTRPRGPRRRPLADLTDMLSMAGRIVAVCRAERPALLHAHSSALNGVPALWASRRLGLPLVYEVRAFWEDAAVDHGTIREGSLRYRLTRALETFVLKRADAVATICEGMRQDICARGLAPGQVVTVPNGVDLERFQPQAPSERLRRVHGLDGQPVLGFIGSFYRYEGLQFLVRAFATLRKAVPAARLLLVGSGEEEALLRRQATTLGTAAIFTGAVPHADVAEYHSAIDVFVCPRLRMRLTELVTPLKPLEAMATGRPVLASDVGGLSELIEDGRTGVLFAAESVGAFVEKATRLLQDAALRASLGQQGRAFVERERSWEAIVSRYLPLYRALTRR